MGSLEFKRFASETKCGLTRFASLNSLTTWEGSAEFGAQTLPGSRDTARKRFDTNGVVHKDKWMNGSQSTQFP